MVMDLALIVMDTYMLSQLQLSLDPGILALRGNPTDSVTMRCTDDTFQLVATNKSLNGIE
jgi:hypothetical protein